MRLNIENVQNKDMVAVFTPLGASNHSNSERALHDYYATDPKAAELLLKAESFSPTIWEPACGEGHLSKVFEQAGHTVISTDLFLKYKGDPFDGDIITNPPYSKGAEFVEKAIETIADGHKVAMFLKLTFLETEARRPFFDKYPPRTIYGFHHRMKCGKNGDFSSVRSSAIAYAWFVWDKGYTGIPHFQWID